MTHVHDHSHVAPDEPVAPVVPAARDGSAGHAGHTEHDAHAEHVDHDAHAGHSVAMFRDKFWWSLALTLPTLVWGHMLPAALGYMPPMFSGASVIPALFGSALFVYGGRPFLQGAAREVRDRKSVV